MHRVFDVLEVGNPLTLGRIRALLMSESDARTHRTPKALRAKLRTASLLFREALGVGARPRATFPGAT
jgi:hypothetical protein